jgi:Arc/MetJ-type ribon-helix-helix transcriptional regulator
MVTITIPPEVEAWARAQVAAGRADSVSGAITDAIAETQQLQAFRAALDAAEAEPGEDTADAVFTRLKARFTAP